MKRNHLLLRLASLGMALALLLPTAILPMASAATPGVEIIWLGENLRLAATTAVEKGDLIPVINSDNKFGYIDESGQVVIPPEYDFASHFFENKALVSAVLPA